MRKYYLPEEPTAIDLLEMDLDYEFRTACKFAIEPIEVEAYITNVKRIISTAKIDAETREMLLSYWLEVMNALL